MNDEVEGKRSTYSNKRQAPPPPPPSAKFPDKAQALTIDGTSNEFNETSTSTSTSASSSAQLTAVQHRDNNVQSYNGVKEDQSFTSLPKFQGETTELVGSKKNSNPCCVLS